MKIAAEREKNVQSSILEADRTYADILNTVREADEKTRTEQEEKMAKKSKSKVYPGPQPNPVKGMGKPAGTGEIVSVKGKAKGGGAATKGLSLSNGLEKVDGLANGD